VVSAAPGLPQRRPVRRAALPIDRELSGSPPPDWADDLDQIPIPGMGFCEVAFLHRRSRTLVLTDLVVNLEPDRLPALVRPLARLMGVTAPEGRAPPYLRLIVRLRRKEAGLAAQRLLDWQPERVVFSHGAWFDADGAARLRRALDWILPA
jgi:hypothetical protein